MPLLISIAFGLLILAYLFEVGRDYLPARSWWRHKGLHRLAIICAIAAVCLSGYTIAGWVVAR